MKVRTGLLLNIVLGILGAVVLNAVLLAVFHATWVGIIGQLIVAGAAVAIEGLDPADDTAIERDMLTVADIARTGHGVLP